jgi:hypothetical protein
VKIVYNDHILVVNFSQQTVALMTLALPCLLMIFCATNTRLNAVPPQEQSEQGSPGGQDARPAARPADRSESVRFAVIVTDENGVAVAAAQIFLSQKDTRAVFRGETDHAGRYEFLQLRSGDYDIRVEKEGFYAVSRSDISVAQSDQVAITLNHFQEFSEHTEVVYSPPTVDPAKTASAESLTTREIVNLPYPTTRDFRNVLPTIPGVLRDPNGQIHINGAATHQIFDQLDGFNITHPATGALEMRVSVDALRQIEVQGSRYSAEYGKGSGGAVSLTTGMGDDHFRFSATNFVPSVQSHRGLKIDDWTPRITLSGPLRKARAWFFNATDGETHLNAFKELPPGADASRTWRFSNLTKVQANLTASNILTTSVLVNRFRSAHFGLSRFNPVETTRTVDRSAYLFTVKDQILFSGVILGIGFAFNTFDDDLSPRGNLPYVIRPKGNSGNFFKSEQGDVRRFQWIADLIFQPHQWLGKHEFKTGIDADKIRFHRFSEHRPIFIYRQNGTLSRRIEFVGTAGIRRNNSEFSGYAQDRWSPTEWLLVELGIRSDWDQIIRQASVSPRLASTCTLPGGNTKLSAGIGIFHDATNLSFITRPLEGRRIDLFYPAGSQTPGRPLETSFEVNESQLRAPRFHNWSLALERMLPASVYARVEFIQKRGSAFTFVRADEESTAKALYTLRNFQRDRFNSLEFTLKKNMETYGLMASYTRSSARSNAAIDFNLDNPIFAQQGGGPLPWDAPNRLLSWGWLPLRHGYDFAYLLEWRSGYPYSLVNEEQRLVGAVNTHRLPDYFILNLHVERRFRLSGHQWALRAGFNNVTGHENPAVVNNNIDSPEFMTFGGIQSRVFTARIRLLGRK